MNIFKQYGIKEVADVTFYSITRIGKEEFYIPVLYFDTLKVTTLDKSIETVNANGGKGNGKIISWNFGKDLKVKLEDALFSQMSLNTFMNGRVMAKLSNWTSAIAKLNVANKYGQKNYSIKAFPSPELTAAEWDIVFRCAQKSGFDSRNGSFKDVGLTEDWKFEGEREKCPHGCKYLYNSDGQDQPIDSIVAENRWRLVDQYYHRTQPSPKTRDLSEFFDYNTTDYESINIVMQDLSKDQERKEAQKVADLNIGDRAGGWRNLIITYRKKGEDYELERLDDKDSKVIVKFHYSFEKTLEGCKGVWAYISANIPTLEKIKDILTGYNKTSENLDTEGNYNPTFHIGDEFFLNHILYYLYPNYLEDAIGDLCWCDLKDKFYKAMPQKIIDEIAREINTFQKMGYFENDLYEAKTIDRMEKCVVKDIKGLKIDLIQQMQNVKKLYNNTQETFTVFYDAKTMLPFMDNKILDEKILAQKCVRVYSEKTSPTKLQILNAIKNYLRDQYDSDWVSSLTEKDYAVNKITDQYGYREYNVSEEEWGDYEEHGFQIEEQRNIKNLYLVYFNVIKHDYINLKYGTVYYKWSRTIDEDNTEQTFIGTDLSIDVDTFPGEYMIVGETYIREQQTGKDQRYQLLLPRTAISASTSLKLQASGEPTTFSIDVNVLTPIDRNKSMIELRQYNVEEDTHEGGYRIVPQDKRHSYTPTIEVFEQIVPQNNEIY